VRAWIAERHREEEKRLARTLWRDRMEAALAAPWAKDPAIPKRSSAKPEIETAVEFFRDTHYEPGYSEADLSEIDPTPLIETRERASLYLGYCKKETGDTIPDDVLLEHRRADLLLDEQTAGLAQKLEAGGYQAYRRDGSRTFRVFVHSRHIEEIPPLRRVVILPSIAKKLRRKMLLNLEYFIQENEHCRMWTFTSGPRVNVLDLRERIQYLHRRISQLNAQPFMRDAGVSLVFRSTELGLPKLFHVEQFGEIEQENGEFFFHPHAHCLAKFSKYLHPNQFEKLLSDVKNFWGHHWDDAGEIHDANELCKYIVKPSTLLNVDQDTVVALARAVFRLKLCVPLGAFKDVFHVLKANSKQVISEPTHDGPVLRQILDWNKQIPLSVDVKHRIEAQRLSRKEGKPFTRIVARCRPQIGPMGVKEPVAIVVTNEGLPGQEFWQHPAIVAMIACSATEFAAGVAIRVHTCTPTVLPGLNVAEFSAWKPPNDDSIAAFFAVNPWKSDPKCIPDAYSPQKNEENTPPKVGDRVTVRLGNGCVRRMTIARVWCTKAGTIRLDAEPGEGFRPGMSVDLNQVLADLPESVLTDSAIAVSSSAGVTV
jgi:hypothetical protein